MAWSGSITTPAAGQSLWAIDGTYNPNTNQTSWSSPYLTQGFPTTIQSDNYVLNTSGWQIQRDTGNAYFNAISARGNISGGSNINITGNAVFDGAYSSSGSTYAVVANASYNANGGVIGYANGIFQAAIFGQASGNAIGGLFQATGSQAALQGYSSGTGNGLYVSGGTMAISNNTLVTNLYSQYTYYLKGQATGASNLYFQTGPTTGASTASFTATNKPGTTSGSNTWIEVVIGGVSYQIPVWAS